MSRFEFALDMDEDLTNIGGSFALMTSALWNELYPGEENRTKWCATCGSWLPVSRRRCLATRSARRMTTWASMTWRPLIKRRTDGG